MMAAYNPRASLKIRTDIGTDDRTFAAHHTWSAAQAVAADADGVHAAIAGKATAQNVTSGFTNPPCARNITVTPGGTTGDVKAGDITIYGKDIAGNSISEAITFAADADAAVSGAKCFASVDKVTVPAQDGTGCTFTVGFGDKLGMPARLPHNTVILTVVDGAREATAPTVTASATDIADNGITCNTALSGKAVDVYYLL